MRVNVGSKLAVEYGGQADSRKRQRTTDGQGAGLICSGAHTPARFVLGIHRKMSDSWHLFPES